jgi:hypothetical protein
MPIRLICDRDSHGLGVRRARGAAEWPRVSASAQASFTEKGSRCRCSVHDSWLELGQSRIQTVHVRCALECRGGQMQSDAGAVMLFLK